jgi:endonuclease/exonuclease/phosphatase family metal-dependent hydrolase
MKKWRGYIVLAVCLLLAVGVWHASQHRAIGPAEGDKICGAEFLSVKAGENAPATSEKAVFPPFRIATFNLHGCKGTDGRVDVARVGKLLEKFDFVGLQEVHGAGLFGGDDQTAALGKALKMGWLFAPAVQQWYCLESGNGFLTSYPISFWERIPLASHRDYSHRNVVLLGLEQKNLVGQKRTVKILVAHVNRRYDEDRQAQLRAVIALFQSLEEPAILLGDLNSSPQETQITNLLNNPSVVDAIGDQDNYSERIDWILARGLKSIRAGVIGSDASDHPLVWAELE